MNSYNIKDLVGLQCGVLGTDINLVLARQEGELSLAPFQMQKRFLLLA